MKVVPQSLWALSRNQDGDTKAVYRALRGKVHHLEAAKLRLRVNQDKSVVECPDWNLNREAN
jgi:hypothetical protein